MKVEGKAFLDGGEEAEKEGEKRKGKGKLREHNQQICPLCACSAFECIHSDTESHKTSQKK